MQDQLPALPTAEHMESTARDIIDAAVEKQLPTFIKELIDGMKPGVDELLAGGFSKEQVKAMVYPHIEKYVSAFDPESVDSAVASMYEYIDSAPEGATR